MGRTLWASNLFLEREIGQNRGIRAAALHLQRDVPRPNGGARGRCGPVMADRPGKAIEEMTIDLPHLRNAATTRAMPKFGEYVAYRGKVMGGVANW